MNVTLSPGFAELIGAAGRELASPHVPTREQIDRFERVLLQLPQIDLGTTHCLSGKVYVRCIFIPKNGSLTGAVHKTDHVNIVLGDITVSTDDGMKRITGFQILPTKAGMKRVGVAHADTYWATCCATSERNIEAIEDELVEDAHLLQTRQGLLIGAAQTLKVEA